MNHMSKPYKSCNRNQMLLLPPSLYQWLPKGHLAYFIIDIVEQLDLSAIYEPYEKQNRGQPPYEPSMMTALLLYAYCVGVPSSRKIEQKTHEDVAFRVLAANRNPDHDSICAFRKRHLKTLAGLFVHVLRLCQEAGLVRLGHIALDGTKVKANASKHKAMSYGRMKKTREELEREIEDLLSRAEAADAEEDACYGKGKKGWDLPEELKRRETRLERIKEAMGVLEAEAREKAKKRDKEKDDGGDPPDGPPAEDSLHTQPSDKAQRNFTDPDSRIMKVSSTKSFEQSYNCQAAVDEEAQVIVGALVTQQANDVNQVEPMLDELEANLGRVPFQVKMTMDAGYFSDDNIMLLEDAEVDPFVATGRLKHGETPPSVRGRPPQDMTTKERMSRKLRTKRGQAAYARRKATVEPVFGQIKHVRGFKQFLLRGLENVGFEWLLWCLTHNLLKLHRYGSPCTI